MYRVAVARQVAASFHLVRRHRFFTLNLIMPCVMLSSLTLVTFLSPPDQGEKTGLAHLINAGQKRPTENGLGREDLDQGEKRPGREDLAGHLDPAVVLRLHAVHIGEHAQDLGDSAALRCVNAALSRRLCVCGLCYNYHVTVIKSYTLVGYIKQHNTKKVKVPTIRYFLLIFNIHCWLIARISKRTVGIVEFSVIVMLQLLKQYFLIIRRPWFRRYQITLFCDTLFTLYGRLYNRLGELYANEPSQAALERMSGPARTLMTSLG